MCGIFGYVGPKNAFPLVISGVKNLEYRGYDSAGVAGIVKNELIHCKRTGKVANLQQELQLKQWEANIAVAHTRWATHGKPSEANAHPLFDAHLKLAVVHNGIIENFESIKKLLKKKGIIFRSETDTETISQLIGFLYKGDLLKAVRRSLFFLKGAFAIAVIHVQHPDQIICVAKESPLAIGLGKEESYVASDASALLSFTKRVIYLQESEIAVVKANSIQAFNQNSLPVSKECQEIQFDLEEVSKGKYAHYTHKEIFEQPHTIKNALLSRYSEELGSALLDEIQFFDEDPLKIKRILILGCGTSYHAGLIASYMFEELAGIPSNVEISSEYRYKKSIVQEGTLVLAISQSGETADTIAAMRELKEKGAKIVGICNVQGSTVAREADSCLFLRAGPEIGVASTKAFTSQLTVLALIGLRLARMRSMSREEGKRLIAHLLNLPEQVRYILTDEEKIIQIARKYADFNNFFFLGRRFMYPTALEGALKLKEMAYVNANGYPAGEMKHGPIALINEQCPTLAFCSDSITYSKMLSNLREVKARSGKIIAIATLGSEEIDEIADDVLWIPSSNDCLNPILASVSGQLFAYHSARIRGAEIDQPRNLAKSVTVE